MINRENIIPFPTREIPNPPDPEAYKKGTFTEETLAQLNSVEDCKYFLKRLVLQLGDINTALGFREREIGAPSETAERVGKAEQKEKELIIQRNELENLRSKIEFKIAGIENLEAEIIDIRKYKKRIS